MQPDGVGALAVAFEQLKRRLDAEGLFDPARKRPIPPFARSVGVITSASGAALHDIINVSGRRCPSTRIVIYPAYVQGEMAPRSLVGGIRFFNEKHPVDVIIIGRGGGSAEDLWGFNDEELARTIAASNIPVISAVGHETDFTICDFVADLRAPTPSAAAEIAFPNSVEIRSRITHLKNKADALLERRIYLLEGRLQTLKKNAEIRSPERVLDEKASRLALLKDKMDSLARASVDGADNSFRMLCTRLEGVSPLTVLSHGYAMVQGGDGRVISAVADATVGEVVDISLSDGKMRAQITEISEK
jgi:exodeoxyribonuclease VII large subunit